MPPTGQAKQVFDAAADRLRNFYEGQRPYDPVDNPGGLRRGGNVVNSAPALSDVAEVGAGIGVLAGEVSQVATVVADKTALAETAAARAWEAAKKADTTVAGRAAVGGKDVNDADYQAAPANLQIMMKGLTQSRTIRLPRATQFKFSRDFVALDADGLCSEVRTIVIQASGDHTINGQVQIILFDAFQSICLHHGADKLWIRLQ